MPVCLISRITDAWNAPSENSGNLYNVKTLIEIPTIMIRIQKALSLGFVIALLSIKYT
jgi:hypothetical protein